MPLSPLWIKVSTQLPRHPKTRKAADALGVTVAELVGRLCMLWIYCAEFRPDGKIRNAEELAAAMEWNGDALELVRALATIPCFHGFIDCGDDFNAGFSVHDWDVFNAQISGGGEKRREKKIKEENARDARDHEIMNEQPRTPREIPPEVRARLQELFKKH